MTKRLLKYLGFAFLGLVTLLIILIIFTQTSFFRDWLRNKIVTEANKTLDATLSIGSLHGNLVRDIRISEIFVEDEHDTVLFVPSLEIKLSPRLLLHKQVFINSLLIDSPRAKFRQAADSSWNVSRLVKPGDTASANSTNSTKPLDWSFVLENFQIKNGQLDFTVPDTASIVNGSLNELDLRLSGYYDETHLTVAVDTLRLLLPDIGVRVRECTFEFSADEDRVRLRDFVLRTGQNSLSAEASYDSSDGQSGHVDINTDPVHANEFKLLLPELSLRGRPELTLVSDLRDDSLNIAIDITESEQSVHMRSYFTKLKSIPSYTAEIAIENLDSSKWLENDVPPFLLNGTVSLTGRGLTPDVADIRGRVKLRQSLLASQPVESLVLSWQHTPARSNIELDVEALLGKLYASGDITELTGSRNFNLTGTLSHFDISHLTRGDSLTSDVNLSFRVAGSGSNAKILNASASLIFSESRFQNVLVDSLFCEVDARGTHYRIDTLFARSDLGRIHASGIVTTDSLSSLVFEGQLGDLSELRSLLPVSIDTLNARGRFFGHAAGSPDSLALDFSLTADSLIYNSYRADTLRCRVNGLWQAGEPSGLATIELLNAGNSTFKIAETRLDTRHDKGLTEFHFDIAQNDSLGFQAEASVERDSLTTIVWVPVLELDLRKRRWSGGSDSTRFVIREGSVQVKDFKLASKDALVELDGILSMDAANDLSVRIDGLELAAFSTALGRPDAARGQLSLDVDIRGPAERSTLAAVLSIEDGRVYGVDFQHFQTRLNYADSSLACKMNVLVDDKYRFQGEGSIPMKLTLPDRAFIYDREPVKFRLHTEEVPLSALQNMLAPIVTESEGMMTLDITLGNTLSQPKFSGFFRLHDGALKMPDYGVTYQNIQVALELVDSILSLTNFSVESNRGKFSAQGKAYFDSTGILGKLRDMDVSISASGFQAVNNRNLDVQFGGKGRLSGQPAQPVINGDIKVERSKLYLPAIVDENPQTADKTPPLLVAASAKNDSTPEQLTALPKQKSQRPELIRNLRGAVKVEIPRNCWIQSPNMNIEISGTMEVVKNGEEFELFGTITCSRGHYEIYGKRFEIKEGSITFEGGAEYDPRIEIQAEHQLRTYDREKRTLRLVVSGKASEPEIQFTLDDAQITEGDAVSYLFFGRSLDELTRGAKSELSESSDLNLAKDVAATLLSAQLTRALGSTLELDMLEINASQSWQNASFVVGKYVTNDLFVSYEQQFGERQSSEVAPYILTLEYEVTPFLFLQLINGDDKKSGYDVILKFER